MDLLKIYIIAAYAFVLGTSALGAFNMAFCANLTQRFALLLFAVWAAWRIQLIVEHGYAWPHEPLAVTALALYAFGTVLKTIHYRKERK